MNSIECDELLKRLSLSERNQEMVKRVLVKGEKQIDVAREFDVSKQLINRNLKKVINASEKINRDDWVYSTAILPSGLSNLVKFLEDKVNGRKPGELLMTAKEAELLIDAIAVWRK